MRLRFVLQHQMLPAQLTFGCYVWSRQQPLAQPNRLEEAGHAPNGACSLMRGQTQSLCTASDRDMCMVRRHNPLVTLAFAGVANGWQLA
jgi:hypothetical protein